jgi:hypothetical protein
MERTTELQNIDKAEKHNLDAGIKSFTNEVYFYYELSRLFSLSENITYDKYYIVADLFQLCSHNLTFCFINILRGHFTEPLIINRKSIEAVAHATIISENLDLHSRIWCKGENKNEQESQRLFESIFKKDKFRSCKNKKQLNDFFKIFSQFTHSNITANIHRTKRTEYKLYFGYFDFEVDNVDAWMIRYLNHTLVVYLLILEEFANIFGDNVKSLKEHIGELKKEHRQYMETRRSLLSQSEKYA